ncbi:hypothetical protein GQ44DRAFT_714679 [Phaeosphaeriaceae sp. PMI808]|nr:hypothetical protein GQ44DRAFT_714679 [Phaeosphaeriaceae sp. PMI808]
MSQRSDYQPHDPDKALAPWNKDQNTSLDQWNYVPPARDYFDEPFEMHDESGDEDYDWYDDGPTTCRDCIDDCDYHFYYSD